MTNPFKNQYTADGVNTDFVYSFEIPINRTVLAYETLTGNTANEDADLVSNTLYIIIPDNPTSPTSTGIVRFNTPPADQSIITLTPDQETLVTYTFSNTAPFNTDNLNGAFTQESQSGGYNLQNFLQNSIRYNVNENDGNIAYDNKVSPLADNGFWRRIGAGIVSQDFDEFVSEVSSEVLQQSEAQTNAGADNTNLSNAIASNDQGVQYSGNPKRVDPSGTIIVDPLIQGFSAKAGAHWAQEWAESPNQINDDYGNSGRSAKFYSDLSAIAAGSATGIIDQLRVFDNVNATTQVDLINYDTNEPWVNVLENSLSVYLDGVRLQEPTAYSPPSTPATNEITYTVTIKDTPTLGDPTFITFDSPVPVSTEIYVTRGEAQGDGSTMFKNYGNASPSPETDLNTTLSNAGIFHGFEISDAQPMSGSWYGGVTVDGNNGVDSSGVQYSIGIESDGTPNVAYRANLSSGFPINPANWGDWYTGVTIDSNLRVKQSVRQISYDHTDLLDQAVTQSTTQSYNASGNNAVSTWVQGQGVNQNVIFSAGKKVFGSNTVFDMLQVSQTSDTQGEATCRIFGSILAGASGSLPLNTSALGFDKWISVADYKSSGTSGGSSVFGFQTRDLNTILSNPLNATLSQNEVTLDAGTYIVYASAPCFQGKSHRISVKNGDGSIILLGTTEYNDSAYPTQTSSVVAFKDFTITQQDTFKINHFITSGKSNDGLGVALLDNRPSIYSQITFWKVK
jgi:hypothetical protein